MSEDTTDVGARARKPIILIGAPSGAGKTVLSQQIIASEVPFFTRLLGDAPAGAVIRYDLKVLPPDPPSDRILIIECATHRLEHLAKTDVWQRMLALARQSERVICVNLDVPRRTVALQYFRRIFTEPKRQHVLRRVVQLSKYRHALTYLLTRRLSHASAAWRSFEQRLAAELAPRVALVHARRSGADLNLQILGDTR